MKADGERGGEPRRISDIVSSLMASRGYGRLQGAKELREAWEQASGRWTAQTRPGNCQRGVLEVVVTNSVILQELNFQKANLLKRLQELVPEQKVRDLRFRLGQVD